MTENKKCSNCGGRLLFNPKTQQMFCEYCRTSRDVVEETPTDLKKNSKNLDIYSCPSCGAQIICDETTSSTFCVYCKNTAIIKERLKGDFLPQAIIPFKSTKEEAIDAFIQLRKGKKLIPDEFLKEQNIEEIKGIYIPFWFFDYQVDGTMDATATTKSTSRGFNSTIITTSYFNVRRSGNISYDNIPVDASTHFQNNIMRSIEPFNYNEIKKYSSDYLSGFLSEIYNVSQEHADVVGTERARKTAYDLFYKSIEKKQYNRIKVEHANFNIQKTAFHYVLLPVYMLNIKYRNQFYTFAMNGQTKKMIGNIPVDKTKAIKYFFKNLLIFSIISLIITFIIWKVGT